MLAPDVKNCGSPDEVGTTKNGVATPRHEPHLAPPLTPLTRKLLVDAMLLAIMVVAMGPCGLLFTTRLLPYRTLAAVVMCVAADEKKRGRVPRRFRPRAEPR